MTDYTNQTLSVFFNSPVAALWPSRLSFGSQPFGTSSAERTVTLSNPGGAPLAISSIVANGDFIATNNCGSTIAIGGSCQVDVTFEPTAEGTRMGTLSFTSNASVVPQTLVLSGTGEVPGVSLSASSLTFTGQIVGTTSPAQAVQLTNAGDEALAITSIVVSGDFAETNGCGSSLAPAAICTINGTFKPTAGGSRTGTLTITDNAAGSPHTVNLTGTGQDFSVAVASGSSSTATVTPGQTATYSLSLGGLGGLSQAISFACTGAPSEATCTVNPSSATPSGAGPFNITVKVATTAPSLAAPTARRSPPAPLGEPLGFLPPLKGGPFGVVLFGLFTLLSLRAAREGRKTSRNELRLGLVIASLAMLTLLLAACDGGGSSGNKNPGTPAGTYTLTITGTLSGSRALQHSTTLTLKVS
jgi:hypothetical protein